MSEETVVESDILVAIIEKNEVAKETGKMIIDAFRPFVVDAMDTIDEAKAIVVTDESQKDEMKRAHELRMKYQKIRTAADKKRKELKEDSNRYGKAVQGVFNAIEGQISVIEEHLEAQEKFVERREAKRIADLRAFRANELAPYSAFVISSVDLGVLSDDDYNKLLSGSRAQYEAALRKDEDERKKADDMRREQEAENERDRVRKEAIMPYRDVIPGTMMFLGKMTADEFEAFREDLRTRHDAKAEADAKKAAELKLDGERREALSDYSDVLPAALPFFGTMSEDDFTTFLADMKGKHEDKAESDRLKKEADEKAAAEAAEKKRAAAAPDKEKITAFAATIKAITAPECASEDAKDIIEYAKQELVWIADALADKASRL